MWEKLWRRTVMLAREYPGLWLPVIFAELAGFALRTYKHAAILFVVRLLSPMFSGHSVLSRSIGYGDSLTGIAFVAASVIAFMIQLAPIVLYTIAYFVTAHMVWLRVGFEGSAKGFHAGRKITALSIRGLLLGGAAGIVIGLVSVAYLESKWQMAGLREAIFTDVTVAMVMCGFAYVMVPPAMRLLAESAKSLNEHSLRLGRKCAIAAVLASTGLLILEHLVVGIVDGTHTEIRTFQAIGSLIAALPYPPLYIALSLLARDEQKEATQEQAVLMPEES